MSCTSTPISCSSSGEPSCLAPTMSRRYGQSWRLIASSRSRNASEPRRRPRLGLTGRCGTTRRHATNGLSATSTRCSSCASHHIPTRSRCSSGSRRPESAPGCRSMSTASTTTFAMPSVMAPTAVAQRSPHSLPPWVRRSTGGWRWRRSALASSSPATICCGRLGRRPAGAVTTSSRRFIRLPARTLTVNHSQVTGPTGCDSTRHLPHGRFGPSRCTTPRTTALLDTSSRTRSSGT